MLKLTPQPVKYRGVISGLRISSVDGTAFIDGANSSVTDLADGNHQISIFDSTGKELRGVLKAAGSAETLGDELITSWTNSPQPYETLTVNANGHDIDAAINTSSYGLCHMAVTQTVGNLIKASINVTSGGGIAGLRCGFTGGTSYNAPTLTLFGLPGVEGANDYYRTMDNAYTHIQFYSNSQSDNFSATTTFKQVLTPSSSGCTVVSTKGGVTYNWSLKTTGFTYNAASYQTVIRKAR